MATTQTPPPAQSIGVACTPSPQKAAVFNVAEYKRQLAQQQQQQSQQVGKAKAEPKKKDGPAAGAASKEAPKAAKAAKAPVADAGPVREVDLQNPGTPLMKVEARYDFEGNASKDELSFQKGDFITVYGKASSEGWWVGRLQGEKKAGLLPANYVKLVKKFV